MDGSDLRRWLLAAAVRIVEAEMMKPLAGRRERYRAELRALRDADWASYLREHSGLPGPRANLELASAVAEEASPERLGQLLATDEEYLVLCGTIGLGRLLAAGAEGADERLRSYAKDTRWRVREGVAMGLQRLGDADLPRLVTLIPWSSAPRWQAYASRGFSRDPAPRPRPSAYASR
jgi:hypothetical protein